MTSEGNPQSLEAIIKKLEQVKHKSDWKQWTLDETKQLLELYYTISKQEPHLFYLVYKYHGCDSWEDIFRDYNSQYLKDKTDGVKVALDAIHNR